MPKEPGKNRNWIWFFLALVLLGGGAGVSMIVYNLSQQLTAQQLEAARQLWKEKGPRDYLLTYTVKRGQGQSDFILVRVEKGKVVGVQVNQKDVEDQSKFKHYGVDMLFHFIEDFLVLKEKKGQPRTYLRADFDPSDGHLHKFVRRVLGQNERVEIVVENLEKR